MKLPTPQLRTLGLIRFGREADSVAAMFIEIDRARFQRRMLALERGHVAEQLLVLGAQILVHLSNPSQAIGWRGVDRLLREPTLPCAEHLS